jgi:anti-sigma regulatory factor (Ser/Thr protein kinase)
MHAAPALPTYGRAARAHEDRFRCAATLSALPAIRHRLLRFYRSRAVEPDLLDCIHLAAGEAVSNAIRHGCRLDSARTVEVRCHVSAAAVVVEVRDPGPGFDPAAVGPRPLTDLVPGGRGVALMRSTMDSVDFTFTPAGTTVRLLKRRR